MQTRNLCVDYGGAFFAGYNYEALPLGAALLVAAMQIDQAADVARSAMINDPLRALEHQRAAEQAKAFAESDYSGATPAYVQAWADAANLSPQAAAESILLEAEQWSDVLLQVRTLRLKGKQEVARATSHEAAQEAADEAINAIKGIAAGLGAVV